ncbi:hypothetical protein [Micromonospora coxensis]|uniref:Uncharacterized protein n=1 Tax=Micromonospora coxensis TaxID=356852 RepID=A0A1C5IGD0_9ACTN|nr:hypothetical protein [Micromonospora coxensis]SCG57498.1 hypothetical protein GA0070614_2773 [Micromonospora coxensis]
MRSAAPVTAAGSTVRYRGLAAPVTLDDGTWRGRDGTTVTLQQACGVGDLDGDATVDAVGAVALNSGGSGTFFTLVARHGSGGRRCSGRWPTWVTVRRWSGSA